MLTDICQRAFEMILIYDWLTLLPTPQMLDINLLQVRKFFSQCIGQIPKNSLRDIAWSCIGLDKKV